MRRLFFFLLLVLLVAYGWHRYTQLTGGPERRSQTHYTLADRPKIDLKDVQVLATLDAEYSRLVDAVVPAVVSITSRRVGGRRVVDPFDFLMPRRGQGPAPVSLGSGVIVTREGHILTNHHVVAGMNEIQVQLTDGRIEPAQLIGSDEQTDIAVLKISAPNLDPLPLGDSDEVRVGQMVFAVGNPFGLQETVTQGIISAKGRRAMRDSGVEFLQTDAAVNQGNSGGPLLNLRGEIIGINSAIYSETGGWLGISFAIPANVARRALESVIKTGKVVRGYLGIMMMNLTPELAREFGSTETTGALITDVLPGSPAEKAGLQSGDIIRSINGKPVRDSTAVRARIADVNLGESVEVTVLREGKLETMTSEIAESPAQFAASRLPRAPQPGPRSQQPRGNGLQNVLRGVGVTEVPDVMRDEQLEKGGGVLVAQIEPGSSAARFLRPGDIVEEINQQRIGSVADYEKAAAALPPGERALLYVLRGQNRSFVVITP